MQIASNSTLMFNVHRSEPELISPARPTPAELKPLSDIDDQEGLRYHLSTYMFYTSGQLRAEGVVKHKDPAKAIKAALAEALVYYYPWAGRLREGPARKLMVDCTAEGVVFVEADADVRLEQFGGGFDSAAPFPCVDHLLYNNNFSLKGVLDCPLLTMQVTRLLCGGFIVALRFCHALTDGKGIIQFLTAVTELARGADAPSILPVWRRELLNARDPPRVTCTHHEYGDNKDRHVIDLSGMVHRSFFFGPTEITALRRRLPPHLRRNSSTFELLTAFLWRCRTVALQVNGDEQVRLSIAVNARPKFDPPLPVGYYGNASFFPASVAAAREITAAGSLGCAVEHVKAAKESVTEEYMRSVADLMVGRNRPNFSLAQTYMVSDVSRVWSPGLDFGWGEPVYSGPTYDEAFPDLTSFIVAGRNAEGEEGKMVHICLPADAMERFVVALNNTILM